MSLANRNYVNSDNKVYCADHFKCHSCNQPIDSQIVFALGKRFHVNHFNCAVCRKSLVGEPFYDKGGSPHCGACFGS